MAKKAAKKHKAGKDELPLEGAGVNIPRIDELDDAAATYQKIKKARCAMTPKEVAAKEVVISLIMKHASKLPKDDKGVITYRNNELLVQMKHGKDSLSVKDVEPDADESQLKD